MQRFVAATDAAATFAVTAAAAAGHALAHRWGSSRGITVPQCH